MTNVFVNVKVKYIFQLSHKNMFTIPLTNISIKNFGMTGVSSLPRLLLLLNCSLSDVSFHKHLAMPPKTFLGLF